MKKKPLIGLTLDLENIKSYSKFPWYAIRQNYCSAISNMGGIPIPLVYDINSINTMVEKLDGFIITGGAFDINPSYFSEKKRFNNVVTKEIDPSLGMAKVYIYEELNCNSVEMDWDINRVINNFETLSVLIYQELTTDIKGNPN